MNPSQPQARNLMLTGAIAMVGSLIWIMLAVDRAFSEVKEAMASDELKVVSAALRNWADFRVPPIAAALLLLGSLALLTGVVFYLRSRLRKDRLNTAACE